jgi:hypothetical protein
MGSPAVPVARKISDSSTDPMREVDDLTTVDPRKVPQPPPRRTGRIKGKRHGSDRISRLAGMAGNLPPAGPGRRAENGSDTNVTTRIERLPDETTPAPLPPSPAAKDAEGWFEQVPTNPAAPPDLDALASGTYPGQADPSRPITDHGQAWFGPSHQPQATGPITRFGVPRETVTVVALIAATCLVVGMVLGALLFGGAPDGSTELPAAVPCDPAPAE